MKLSENTVGFLKNYATINQSLEFREGKLLRTVSPLNTILASVEISEDFPKTFPIYELNRFLGTLSLFNDPDLDFEKDEYLIIREGKKRNKFFFADPNVIVSPPEKSIELPSEDVSFELTTQQLNDMLKASSIYQVPDLSVIGENGVVKLVVRDKKNDTSNNYEEVVGETDKEFVLNFKVENIKILPGSYNVVISNKLLSRFQSKNLDLKYYIALEPDSTFE